MFNPSTSQKSLFEMAQVATNTMREITNANLALATRALADASSGRQNRRWETTGRPRQRSVAPVCPRCRDQVSLLSTT